MKWVSVATIAAFSLIGVSPVLGNKPLSGKEIHFRAYGNPERQALILVHGMHSTLETFDWVARALKDDFHVIVYDQRGHGRTQYNGLDYSMDLMARDLESLMNHLHLERAHILGHSFGARVAVKFAELFPNRVRSIIVEDMDLSARTPGVDPKTVCKAEQIKEGMPEVFSSQEALLSSFEAWCGIQQRLRLHPAHVLQVSENEWKLGFKPHVPMLFGQYASAADLLQGFGCSSYPVLFLQADRGRGLSDFGVRKIRAVRPDAQVVKIVDSYHSIHSSKPEEFLEVVRSFLKEI